MRFTLLRVAVAAALISLAAAAPALAQWRTWMAPDPDGRGQPVLMHGETADGPFLQFWCRGGERRVALVSYDGQEGTPLMPPDGLAIELRSDTSGIWSSDGEAYRHHPGYRGVSYRDVEHMQALAEIVIGAKSQVIVDVIDNSSGEITTVVIDAKGSTAAGRDFVGACFGSGAPAITAPAQEPPQQDAAQEMADIDEQIRQLDEDIGQADDILEEADDGLAQAGDALERVDELLADLPAAGMVPWKTGYTGEPQVFYAAGEAVGGGGVLVVGCQVGGGPLLLNVTIATDEVRPGEQVGEEVFVFASTDFKHHHMRGQITVADQRAMTILAAGDGIAGMLDDLILGSQTLVVTLSDTAGNRASERQMGLVDAGSAAAQVRQECVP